jgi:uncharacterized protein (TIGR02117 family)
VVRHPKPALAWRIMARRVGLSLAIAALLFVVATIATARWGNRSLWPPAPGAPTTEVFIVSHGYHAGIIVPHAALADEASRRGLSALGYLATRFADFDRLEIGWGDEGFYREVPTAESVTMALAIRALFRPGNPSVLHVVGVNGDPRAVFANSDLVRVNISDAGFARLTDMLDATFARRKGSFIPDELRARPLWDESVLSRQRRLSSLQRLQSLDRQLACCRRGADGARARDLAVRPAARS